MTHNELDFYFKPIIVYHNSYSAEFAVGTFLTLEQWVLIVMSLLYFIRTLVSHNESLRESPEGYNSKDKLYVSVV